MGLVRLENSECVKELNGNGRISYLFGGDAECIKERYVRVAAIIIATIDGSKNNCVFRETHKKLVASAISSTRTDVPS